MKKYALLAISLLGLAACQSKEKEGSKEENFEKMVILEEDHSSQNIGGEDQLKMR